MERLDSKREAFRRDIMAHAYRLMQEKGAAGISIRAIARQMDITAPALYHYYSNLDAVVTDLIADSYHRLGNALLEAHSATGQLQHAQHGMADGGAGTSTMRRVCNAYRDWAMTHPTQFQLIFGTPIPGYEAPAEVTVPEVVRCIGVIVAAVHDAIAAGQLTVQRPDGIPPQIDQYVGHLIASSHYETSVDAFVLATGVWSHIHGVVTLEMAGHLGPMIGDVDALYDMQLSLIFRAIGLAE